jgi:phenylglyoxylate dehydrogenase alpha subunit
VPEWCHPDGERGGESRIGMTSKITTRTKEVRVLDGNKACAYGVLLCKPDLVACVPITPMTPLVEAIWQYVADGKLDAELVEADGELSGLSAAIGASAAGGRTFVGTSGQGLAFMFEAYVKAAGNRLPIVMALASRETAAPDGVVSSHQDFVTVRDAGWIQIVCEGTQEVLDTLIMSYRLAEDPEVLLPVNVCYDGYYLSYSTERVELPYDEDVDAFLQPVANSTRPRLCLEEPLTVPTNTREDIFCEFRYKHALAQQKTKSKLDAIDLEFSTLFGRGYGGQIEEYRSEDADLVMVTMGSQTGAVREVVDSLREKGDRVGLVKVRLLRPFPRERLAEALKGKKAVGVIDRNLCFGWQSGSVFMETKAALQDLHQRVPVTGFIAGIGGTDLSMEMVDRAFAVTRLAADEKPHQEVTWLNLE